MLGLGAHMCTLWVNLRTQDTQTVLDTTGRLYDDFIRFLVLHSHREVSPLVNELLEESDQFLFLRDSCFVNLKGVVGHHGENVGV